MKNELDFQIELLISNSDRFASVFEYNWNLPEQSEIARQEKQATTELSNQFRHALEKRSRTLYRHGGIEESYSQQALAMAVGAPTEMTLQSRNIINQVRYDHLIFHHTGKPYYVKLSELKSLFPLNVEKDRYTLAQAKLQKPSINNDDIEPEPQEDDFLQKFYAQQKIKLKNYLDAMQISTEEDKKEMLAVRYSKYDTYDTFLAHLQYNQKTELQGCDIDISPLYVCYLRRKRQLLDEKTKIQNNLNSVPLRLPASYLTVFQMSKNLSTQTESADRSAVIEAQLENFVNYETFLKYLEQQNEIINDDEYAAYGQFIEGELTKLHITHFGWGNRKKYIRYLKPDNNVAFVHAALNSAPGMSILTVIAKCVKEENITLSFGVAANVLLIPLFFWSFHESVEIAKYQNKHHGVAPDIDNPILKKIKKDSTVLAAQTFSAAVLGTLAMNRELQKQIGFTPIESLINTLSPGSLLSGALTTETRAAALQALPWWVNLTAALICGAMLGTLMASITVASTYKDAEFNRTHVGSSFALGMVAGSLMYGSLALNISNDKSMSDFFGLLINGLLGLGLHWSVPKNRYQTPDETTTQSSFFAWKSVEKSGDLSQCSKKTPHNIMKLE